MEILGFHGCAREKNQIISSAPKSNEANTDVVDNKPKRKYERIKSTPVRRSSRLEALHSSNNEGQSPGASDLEEKDVPKITAIVKQECDYENIRNARISENMARLESLGLLHGARYFNKTVSSPCKSNEPNTKGVDNKPKLIYERVELTPVRRSSRVNALHSNKDDNQSPSGAHLDEKNNPKLTENSGEKWDYESVRNARISENKARMESLGLLCAARELNQVMSSSPKSNKTNTDGADSESKRKYERKQLTPIRRSSRLETIQSNKSETLSPCPIDFEEKEVLDTDRRARQARRCESKGRGSIYDPILGICCHFCRQKKLCGEENCLHCGNGEANQPCIGKTACSVCHSSNGIFCRACLKVRYGEEMEEVRRNKEWMCPHCVEEKGINPFWICNSSFCLKKKKLVPTGIAIYQARAQGYKSVAHLLMDQLKKQAV